MSKESLDMLEPPLLHFKAGKKATDPVKAFAILGYHPLKVPDLPSIPKIHVLGPARDRKCKNVMTILEDLKKGKTGKYPRSVYKPFSETFGLDIELGEYEEYKDVSNVYRKITEISRNADRKAHVVVVVSTARSPLGGFYYEIKNTSIDKDVQTQIILKKTVDNYVMVMDESNRGDFLWNFSFGIFSKLGGIPWRLGQLLQGVSAFMSLNTVSSFEEAGIIKREGVVAFELANNWGDPLGRFFSKGVEVNIEKGARVVDLESIHILMEKALDEIELALVDPEKCKEQDYIVIHVKDRYADTVYDKVAETIAEKGFEKFKIIHIQEQGPLRLYDDSKQIRQAWPQAGAYWYLEDGRIAFLFTLGTWRYSISQEREPYIIGARDVSPLQVNFVKGTKGSKLITDDLRHIYHLTRLHYYSADIPRIKMPFTIRLGAKAAHLAASGLASSDFPISFLY